MSISFVENKFPVCGVRYKGPFPLRTKPVWRQNPEKLPRVEKKNNGRYLEHEDYRHDIIW
jgi:hypothetical protein